MFYFDINIKFLKRGILNMKKWENPSINALGVELTANDEDIATTDEKFIGHWGPNNEWHWGFEVCCDKCNTKPTPTPTHNPINHRFQPNKCRGVSHTPSNERIRNQHIPQ